MPEMVEYLGLLGSIVDCFAGLAAMVF